MPDSGKKPFTTIFRAVFSALHIKQDGIPTIDQSYVRAMLNASWVPIDDDLIRRLAIQLKLLAMKLPEPHRPKVPEPDQWVVAAQVQLEDRRPATKRWVRTSGTSLLKRAERHSVSSVGSENSDDRIKVWSLRELELSSWNLEKALREWLRVDREIMSDISERHEGNVDQWLPVVKEIPATWRLLVDEIHKEIVGYWHFVPLSDEAYEAAIQGKLYGGDVTIDKVPFMLLPGRYKIYFVAFSFVRKSNTLKNFRLLWNELLKVLEEFAEKDIFFEEICANAFTDQGLSLCKTVGMRKICAHEDRGEIFSMRLMPLPNLNVLTRYPRLVQLYKREANSSHKIA